MKIDELMRDTTIKLDQAATGKVATSNTIPGEVDALLADSMPDSDFSFPDLLQSFAKLLSRRQELVDVLPQAVQSRLFAKTDSLQAVVTGVVENTTSTAAQTVNVPLAQGISGLARDNSVMTGILRQMISELEFVERVPELENIYDQVSIKKKDETVFQQKNSGFVPQDSVDTQQKLPLVQTLQDRVKASVLVLQSIVSSEQTTSVPAAFLNRMVVQAGQTGKLTPEFAAWVEVVAATLDEMPELPKFTTELAKWSQQADPRIIQLAQTADQPKLVQVWSAVQALAELTQTVEHPVNNFARQTVASQLDVLRSVVQQIVELPALTQTNMTNSQSVAMSQAGRFEMLLSIAGSHPELLEKLIVALPELVTIGEITPASQKMPQAYHTLAQTAPRWLKALSDREEKPALLQFWLAAKAADIGEWLKMEPVDRQRLITVLKELRTTFEQPEAFRAPREDTNSRSFMMQIPMYAPGQETPYPALIQVFEEKKERANGQPPEQEVWVRVSLETDHIGTVDLSFRLQGEKYLSIFSRFANPEAASEFRASLPELRKEMAGTSLELKKVAVAGRLHHGGGTDG